MDLISILTFSVTIALISYFVTKRYIQYARVKNFVDIPNHRSSHSVPTPSGGGFCFVLVSIISVAVYLFLVGEALYGKEILTFLLIASGVAALGYFDDKYELSSSFRFAFQSFATILFLYIVGSIGEIYIPYTGLVELGVIGSIISFFWITGMANIYNFMDGIDGIASVQAITASLGWAIFAYIFNVDELVIINCFIFVTLLSFLYFNWSPASIFMGDVGSLFLGFTFGTMPFLAAALSQDVSIGISIWLGIILLWPFFFDGTFTIFHRISRRENIFKAHRSHLYQRLNIAGLSHAKVSTLYLVFSFYSLLTALIFPFTNPLIKVTLCAALLVLSLFLVVYVNWKEKKSSRVVG